MEGGHTNPSLQVGTQSNTTNNVLESQVTSSGNAKNKGKTTVTANIPQKLPISMFNENFNFMQSRIYGYP